MKPERTRDTLLLHAAAWWAQLLRQPAPDAQTAHLGPLAIARLATAAAHRPTEAQADTFQLALRHLLGEAMSRARTTQLSIGIDYGPDGLLTEALLAAGITETQARCCLPEKTRMWLSHDKIDTSLTGAPSVRYYTLPGQLTALALARHATW